VGEPLGKWAVAGCAFSPCGIGLGAWWAYVVLSFAATGLGPGREKHVAGSRGSRPPRCSHAFTLYKSRGLFKHWALGLAAATFWFTILATWTTRTGLIQSVHAFERNPLLVWILSSFLVVTAAARSA